MKIEIDKYSGFCFGVTRAISAAENLLESSGGIFCLGNLVHNNKEQERLKEKGLQTIDYKDITKITNEKLIIRAHGEAPEIYELLERNKIQIFDETCPVVLKLQEKIKTIYLENPDSQIFIFGKHGHPEVNGLIGQTNNTATIISSFEDIKKIKICFPFYLFAQTTANYDEYLKIQEYLGHYLPNKNTENYFFDTICPSVKKRIPQLEEFCKNHDIVIFVSDYNSSNGKMLFEICKKSNKNSYFVTSTKEIRCEWFLDKNRVGISGATSTPIWLMQNIETEIYNFFIMMA